MDRLELPVLERDLIVQAAKPAVSALAQALLGGGEPFAVGVDAVHEDHDAGQGRALDANQFAVVEQGQACHAANEDAR